MNRDFISQRDKILVAAIEIISDSGLTGLTPQMLSARGGIREEVIYKYFGGIDEILVAVVEQFVKYDYNIMATAKSKSGSAHDKIIYFFDTYATYYSNYKELAALILHYEELLHITSTRDMIDECLRSRLSFLTDIIEEGKESGEFRANANSPLLADVLISVMNGLVLSRRVINHSENLKDELIKVIDSSLSLIEV